MQKATGIRQIDAMGDWPPSSNPSAGRAGSTGAARPASNMAPAAHPAVEPPPERLKEENR